MFTAARLAVKLDFITGLLIKATEMTGARTFRGVEAILGEVIAWRNLMWSLSDAMAANATPWAAGSLREEAALRPLWHFRCVGSVSPPFISPSAGNT
jgi:aromatic ring hydroxylase